MLVLSEVGIPRVKEIAEYLFSDATRMQNKTQIFKARISVNQNILLEKYSTDMIEGSFNVATSCMCS